MFEYDFLILFQVPRLLADIGGTMGLYNGMCLCSFLELVTLLFRIICRRVA